MKKNTTFIGVVVDTDDRDLHDQIVIRLHAMAATAKFGSAMRVSLVYGSCFSSASLSLDELAEVLS